YICEILLNQTFISKNNLYFLTKISNTLELSKLFSPNFFYSKFLFSTELFLIEMDDHFSLLKNPLSIFYGQNNLNDGNKYLSNLITNFNQNYNLATLNLPLHKSQSIIDDELFDQFYL